MWTPVCGYSWGSLREKRRPTVEMAIHLLTDPLPFPAPTQERNSRVQLSLRPTDKRPTPHSSGGTFCSSSEQNLVLFITVTVFQYSPNHSRQWGICSRVVPEALQRCVFLLVWALSIICRILSSYCNVVVFFLSSFSYSSTIVKWNAFRVFLKKMAWDLKIFKEKKYHRSVLVKNIPTLHHNTIMCVGEFI